MISLAKIAKGTDAAPVSECPYTRQSHGIVRMSPTLIAELAAAVHDADEWAIVLQGTREQRGYLVNITGYRVPEQTRSSGHVELPPMDLEPEDVGVIHSHHRLGAFFSTTDTATLNPRFPMSIVIASKRLQYLGFDYKGTGKVTLPCGAGAEVEMFIQPTEGPTLYEVVEVAHRADDLGKCVKFVDGASDQYHYKAVAACGLEEVEALRADAFGKVDSLLDQVKVLARPQLTVDQWNNSGKKSLAGQVKVRTLACSKCGIVQDASESTLNPGTMFIRCPKCNVRTEAPSKLSAKKGGGGKKEAESWFQSLIPNRFKRGDDWCRGCSSDVDFCVCETTEHVHEFSITGVCRIGDCLVSDSTDTDEVYLCNVCGKYDPFDDWECGNCQQAVFCYDCNEGHDERFECRKGALIP